MMVFLPGHIGAVQHNPVLLLELIAVGQTGTHSSLTELGAAPQVMLNSAKNGADDDILAVGNCFWPFWGLWSHM